MLVRASTLVLAVAASAIAAPGSGTVPTSQCNVGTMQCCNSVQSSDAAASALSLLGIINTIGGDVGWNCSPLTVVGADSGPSCNQETACCTGDQQNGLVNLGCSPINVNA